MVFSYKSDLVVKIQITLIAIALISSPATGNNMSSSALYTCCFEVFGKVQGVFFRKYTERKANTLGVRGWCVNTINGTVKGELEAPLIPLNQMKHWLETKGSPASVIERVEFTPTKQIEQYSFNGFVIKK
ncbi:acylphosphatase-2 [Drosophila albomicans]|uniref:acylphosphatase n=1 Tax=Drosophila albomicans TaxID=7291 RepID=A0A9C6W9B1_DROAB|nr:acylphosphatase-2 [Drosophila albomicans]